MSEAILRQRITDLEKELAALKEAMRAQFHFESSASISIEDEEQENPKPPGEAHA